MSLSEVANPKAAAKLIQDFRKRYATEERGQIHLGISAVPC